MAGCYLGWHTGTAPGSILCCLRRMSPQPLHETRLRGFTSARISTLMRRSIFTIPIAAALAGASCASPSPSPPDVAPQPRIAPFPYATVWTAAPETTVRADDRRIAIEHAFTRLDVEGWDGQRLSVRCRVCDPEVSGTIRADAVVYGGGAPYNAADGELSEFLVALRSAAAEGELRGLRMVMSPEFTHSLDVYAGEGVEAALQVWRRAGHRYLEYLPTLLDQGVIRRGGELWVSPPAFVTDPAYTGPRAGFRREGERWVWLFLVGR